MIQKTTRPVSAIPSMKKTTNKTIEAGTKSKIKVFFERYCLTGLTYVNY